MLFDYCRRARENSTTYRRYRHPSSPCVNRTPLPTPSTVLRNATPNLSTTRAVTASLMVPPAGSELENANGGSTNFLRQSFFEEPSYITFSDLRTAEKRPQNSLTPNENAQDTSDLSSRPQQNNVDQTCEYGFEDVVLTPEHTEQSEAAFDQATSSAVASSGPDPSPSTAASSPHSLRLKRIQRNGSDYTLVNKSADNLQDFKLQVSEAESENESEAGHASVEQNASDKKSSKLPSKQKSFKISKLANGNVETTEPKDESNENNNNISYENDTTANAELGAASVNPHPTSGSVLLHHRKSDRNKEHRRTLYDHVEYMGPK